MKTQEYTSAQIKLAKAAPPYCISVVAAINCKMLLAGMPDINPKEDEYWQTPPHNGQYTMHQIYEKD